MAAQLVPALNPDHDAACFCCGLVRRTDGRPPTWAPTWVEGEVQGYEPSVAFSAESSGSLRLRVVRSSGRGGGELRGA